jgi:hypothetical protein
MVQVVTTGSVGDRKSNNNSKDDQVKDDNHHGKED